MDTFGPVSDNAQGIAEMSGDISDEGAQVLTDLDAVGNTTKAITKGIAIATAVLAATALFGSFKDAITTRTIAKAVRPTSVTAGSSSRRSLSRTTWSGSRSAPRWSSCSPASPSTPSPARRARWCSRSGGSSGHPRDHGRHRNARYGRVVDIFTRDALRELATPGLLAVLAPDRGRIRALGSDSLPAYLAGAIGAGTLMAVFLANSGGAWDNAKKLVEDGHYGGKGTEAHAATVIGDTVGDPFKDTAGPAINPLMKVMNLVSC